MNSERISEGLNRWLTCKHSLSQIFRMTGVSSGQPEEGWNEDYSCQNPELVERIESRTVGMVDTYYNEGVIIKAVQMYSEGNTSEPRVQANLNLWCGNCPFYQKKD